MSETTTTDGKVSALRTTKSRGRPGKTGVTKDKFPKRPEAKTEFPGAALINQTWTKIAELGITPRELATELGITYTYLMMLARGERNPSEMGIPTLKKFSKFLGVPVAQAALLAEVFVPEDFFLNQTLEERVEQVYAIFCKDPLYGGFAPKATVWRGLSPDVKLTIAVLYENGSQTRLLDAAKIVKIEPAE